MRRLCVAQSVCYAVLCFFFFKQKTAYEMRISDWSSDVCSSDLACIGCSMVADQVAHPAHLNARDTSLAFVSRASQPDIERVKARMGWEHKIGRASCRERVCQYV